MLSELQLNDLVTRVAENPDGPGYFSEAVDAFRIKRFRSCVVSLSNAVFSHAYDLLKHTVLVDKSYEHHLQEVEQRSNGGEAFETPLANALKAAGLITGEKYQYLDALRKARNRSAHGRGAEIDGHDAAVLLDKGVNLFLADRYLDPLVTVEEIIARVRETGYFPRPSDADRLLIVRSEIERIPAKAYLRLIEQILKSFRTGDDAALENGIAFLRACASMKENGDLCDALFRKLIMDKLGRKVKGPEPYMKALIAVVDIWPECIGRLEPDDCRRLDSRLCEFLHSLNSFDVHFRRAVATAAKLTATDANSEHGTYAMSKAFIMKSLIAGLALLSSESTRVRDRHHIIRNLVSEAKNADRKTGSFIPFAEVNGPRLVGMLRGDEAWALLAALEQRRMCGPRKSNINSIGDFRVPPLQFAPQVHEPVLARLEEMLKPVVQNWIQTNKKDAEFLARRHRISIPEDYRDQVLCLPNGDW